MNNKSFNRVELYDLVWSKPLTTIAGKYAISDNGVRKICKKHNIPLPKMGHWQKIRYGKKTHIIPLPMGKNLKEVEISLNEREENDNGKYNYLSELNRSTKQIEEDPSLCLSVPNKLSRPDLVIKEAKQDLEIRKREVYRGIISTSMNNISISVAPENVARALRFMDTLIKLIKMRGHHVMVENRNTVFVINDEKFKVRCREKLKQVKIKKEHWNETTYVPTGKMSFRIDGLYPKEWQDDGTKMEKKLAKILAKLELESLREKKERAEREEWRKEYERKRLLELKIKKEQEWEVKKSKMLLDDANRWSQSQDLNTFIQEVEQQLKKSNCEDIEAEKWLQWAKKKLITLDPFSEGALSLIEHYSFSESS